MVTTENIVQTNASAYLASHTQGYPITLNISQSVWDWDKWTIVHQTSNSHHITADEAKGIIEALSKALAELEQGA